MAKSAKKPHKAKLAKSAKKTKKRKKKDEVVISVGKDNIWKIASVVLAVVLIVILVKNLAVEKGPSDIATTTITVTPSEYGTVKLDFYVMSQCPYGTQVEDAIAPVLKKLGNSVDFSLDFIAKDTGGGTFESLHGQPEVDGDIVHLCAAKHEPGRYMDMIVCMNKNMRDIPGNWEGCAGDNGLNVDKIKKCFEGDEGKQLMSASIKQSTSAGAGGSPTIFINDEPYQGGRDSTSFLRAICNKLKGHPECQSIPACGSDADCTAEQGKIGRCENPNEENARCAYLEPVEVEFVVLNDKTCGTCDTSRLVQVTKQLFPGAKERNVDIGDEEGKKLVEELNITLVPVYLLDENLVDTATWNANTRIRTSFEKVGSWYKIIDQATGASHYVSVEERKRFYDSIGVVLDDNKPQIDFFVMSYCPYGNQAEELIEPVYQSLKGKVDFNPRYVIYSNYRGGGSQYCIDEGNLYCSMHGTQELNQGLRELCVNKHMGTGDYFKFVLAMNKECNAQNADTCWEPVAEKLGLDTQKITKCEEDEGLDMVKEELRLTTTYGVSGSPTIFVDGEQYQGSRTAAGYQKALCDKFETPPGECENLPEETEVAVTPAGGCG